MALAVAMSIPALPAASHEVRPAVADVEVSSGRFEASIRLTLEPLLAGVDLASVADINESPLSGLADWFRTLPPEELEEHWRKQWPQLQSALVARAGTAVAPLSLAGITVPEVGDTELPRDSTIRLVAPLPPDGSPVTFGWQAHWGPLIVRRVGSDGDGYSAMLTSGALTEPMARPRAARSPLPIILGAVAALAATLGTMALLRRHRRA